MMGIKKQAILTMFLTLLLVCVAVSPTEAANTRPIPKGNQVAEEAIGTGGITWLPKISCEQIVLTIARPDGTVFSKTFKSGMSPSFELSDSSGQPFIDGLYTYELVASPFATRKSRDEDTADRQITDRPEIKTQTGYFTVKGGAIITRTASEQIARPMDEVIYDDLIVDGSLCVGNDCYSGLAFGFDTIVLMENNLRIYFDDTSNTSSFPNNDWRIVINDTTDGGGAYYAIQDVSGGLTPFTIEAGAKTNSLYIDDDGQVGIGTSGPVFELHIKEGDTPSVRLHQSTAYGWPEQIWDIGGNETSFFVRDGTHAARLPFRIEPETPTSTLCLKSDGKVGIGTWSPEFPLELEVTGTTATFALDRTDGATAKISAGTNAVQFGSQSNHHVKIYANNTEKMVVETTGDVGIANTNPGYKLCVGTSGAYCDGGAWVDGSSREFKKNIRDISIIEAMETLSGLNPVKYNYKEDDMGEEFLGFIAEDVPELVATKDRKGMSPMDVVAVLTKVVQQQQTNLQDQESTIRKQNETITLLAEKIAELEKKLK